MLESFNEQKMKEISFLFEKFSKDCQDVMHIENFRLAKILHVQDQPLEQVFKKKTILYIYIYIIIYLFIY